MLVVVVGDGRMMEIVVRMCGWMVINDLIGMGVNVSGDNLNEKIWKLDGTLSGSIAPGRGLSPLLLLLVCVPVYTRIILMQLKP